MYDSVVSACYLTLRSLRRRVYLRLFFSRMIHFHTGIFATFYHRHRQGANLFFQLIARRYEKVSTIFTSNKTFSQWNDIFADVTIASAVLDRVLHHCTVVHIKGESYRLKERKEYLRQKIQATNALFEPTS